jgi:hypothetical protein
MRKKRIYFFSSSLIILFLLVLSLSFTFGKNSNEGNLIGFLHNTDGSSLQGAVIKLKDIYSDKLYTSTEADDYGIVRIKSLKPGLYVYRVSTKNGNFNSNEVLGISRGKTAKVTVSLENYNEKEASAVKEIIPELRRKGEAFIGIVIDFFPDANRADVEIIKGLLKKKDRIHVVGEETDFYQNAKDMLNEGVPVDTVFVNEIVSLHVDQIVKKGDLVLIVSKKGLFPIFPIAAGLALAVGTGFVVYNSKDCECEEVSPYK